MRFHFSKREKIIFTVTFIVVVVAVGAGVFQAFGMRWQNLQEKIKRAEHELRLNCALLDERMARVADQQTLFDLYRQRDSDEFVRGNMLSSLQKLSSEQAVRISDMKPSSARTEKFYREFPVTVVLEGEFSNIMKFFYYAETREYGFEIREFRFSRSYAVGSELRCQAVLSRIFLPGDI